MQMVIDIPEETYKEIKEGFYDKNTRKMSIAIGNGIPLPKGHGRLIDADEFHHILEDMPIRDNDKWFNWLQRARNRLADAPTIIEADNEKDVCKGCYYNDGEVHAECVICDKTDKED